VNNGGREAALRPVGANTKTALSDTRLSHFVIVKDIIAEGLILLGGRASWKQGAELQVARAHWDSEGLRWWQLKHRRRPRLQAAQEAETHADVLGCD